MTNTTQLLNNDSDSQNTFSSTMKTFKELIGYEYSTSRIAFNSDGTEVVFVNESLISRVQIYINGELTSSHYHLCSDFSSFTQFEHNGHKYRLINRTVNWITMAQEVTLYVDGQELATKIDPRLAALTWKQRLHFVVAMAGLGLAIGLLISAL
jgi:hypothetical protein